MSKTKKSVHEREAAHQDSKFRSFRFENARAPPLEIENLGYETCCEASRWRDALRLLGDMRKKVLVDVGCGTGKNSLILAKLGAKVIGIDLSEKSIQSARKWAELQNIQASFRVGVAEELDRICCPNSVDIVLFHAVLHHVYDPNAAIRSASKILKPGGILVTLEPKAENPVAVIGRRFAVNQSPDEHPFRLGELEPMMKRHFGNVKIRYYCLISPLSLVFQFLGLKSLSYFCFAVLDLMDKALLSIGQFKRWTWLQLLWCTKDIDL